MKCPICGIEMRLHKRVDARLIWICRNDRCPMHEKEQEEKEEAQHVPE